MYGGLDSQLFLGNRDLYILDNGQDLNKPLILRQNNRDETRTRRSPSKTEDNVIDSENVVGLMGDDEDIQQAQYNVMSMIDQRLDQFNSDIREQLDRSINNRLTEIENLTRQLKDDRDSNFQEIDELRRISELQTGIMGNMGMLLDEHDGLQTDLTRLDDLVFTQYERDRNDLNLSSPYVQSISSPGSSGESHEYYGKIAGKTYYQTYNKNDNDKFVYEKYTKFPYFLKIDKDNFKDPEDGSYDKFECNAKDNSNSDDDNFICKIQNPKSVDYDHLECLPSKGYGSENPPLNNTEKQHPFKSHKNHKGKCDLEWDPSQNHYICNKWSGDYALTDSLNPTPMIDSDYRKCIPNLIFGDYGHYDGEKLFHMFIILFIIAIILILTIKYYDESKDIMAYFATMSIIAAFLHFFFYTNIGGLFETSLYDNMNVAFEYDNPPHPNIDNAKRRSLYLGSVLVFISVLYVIIYRIRSVVKGETLIILSIFTSVYLLVYSCLFFLKFSGL